MEPSYTAYKTARVLYRFRNIFTCLWTIFYDLTWHRAVLQ